MKTPHSFSTGLLKSWILRAKTRNILGPGGFSLSKREHINQMLYPASLCRMNGDDLALGRVGGSTALLILGKNTAGFDGFRIDAGDSHLWFCPLSHENAIRIRKYVAFTKPSTLEGSETTFGVGDRLGLATPGHLRVLKHFQVAPVLAQQSPRELDLTGSCYEEVIDSATWAVFQEGYRMPWGADGDHLKTSKWVENALSFGCTMITADLSDHLRTSYANNSPSNVQKNYAGLNREYRQRLESQHLSSTLHLDNGERIGLSLEDVMRNALMYGGAIEHAARMFKSGKMTGRPFDFEISIDETDTPTTPEAHIFVAKELLHLNVPVSSLAPRFIGEFQKGIDYRGNIDVFEASLNLHSAIARHFGYRLSIHSGSDKFSVYPLIGRQTRHRFHLKTAGTSWLQALRVIARHNPLLFRDIYTFALDVFPVARTYYHVSPEIEKLPNISTLRDQELDHIFDNSDCRQVMHITYGEILKDTDMKNRLYDSLYDKMEAYWSSLEEHFEKHLELLGVSKR